MPDFDDVNIIRAVKGGDMQAFELVINAFKAPLYQSVYSMIRRHDAADDISQEVFIKFFRSIGNFDEKYPIYPWLKKVAFNMTINYLKNVRQKSVSLGDNMDFAGACRSNTPENNELKTSIRNALDSLENDSRVILTLRLIEELSYKEISEILQCPIGSVMSKLFRARMELKDRLGKAYIECTES
ncbi:MAG: sigma-70 family RNA polymerase sigma factor [Planctomycetes bacterium]|nr:sigma-70 family RNA polymerase sigma factor [Planctomycetota bacterium]